jgi:hypothetical protein
MVRGAIGILLGAFLWAPVFFLLARLLYLVWPAYALHAAAWANDGTYDFTAPMSAFNALFWFLAEIFAGWVSVAVARRREAAWALAALLMGYLSFLHLYYYWDRFPWWYNLLVALPSGPAVLLGGKLAASFTRRGQTVAALDE